MKHEDLQLAENLPNLMDSNKCVCFYYCFYNDSLNIIALFDMQSRVTSGEKREDLDLVES